MKVQPGTTEHKELFCREFIDSHKPFNPEDLNWPNLETETLEKLIKFPIWDEKLTAYSKVVEDPLLQEAINLQAYEEGRHADILRCFLKQYEIPYKELPQPPLDQNLENSFMITGAGECIDSFFAFGFLQISKTSGDYPLALIEVMDPIVQEEARHIMFIHNWLLYRRHSQSFPMPQIHEIKTLLAFASAGWSRLMDLKNMGKKSFTLQATKLENSSLNPKEFINLCLQENRKRLEEFDSRLYRPKLIPRMMSQIQFFL
jgi:tRNA isopentenyl-2-thiomethyl-A-37 hydroxylase MiaE